MTAPAPTSLVELVENLGPRVNNGSLSKEDAIQLVLEFSDGGLTRYGAETTLADWKTLRTTLERQIAETKAALNRLAGDAR